MAVSKLERKVQSVVDRAVSKLSVSGSKKNGKATSRSEEKRVLLNASIPRPRLSIRGDLRKTVVSGVEVIDQFVTSDTPVKTVVQLNPAQAQTFPRLSGFASQFEKYRFRRVRLHYHTGCPATRSGAIGLAIFTQPVSSDSVPAFMPEFGSYEYSAVGTVATSLSTPWWVPKDPEFFYLGTGFTPLSGNSLTEITNAEPLKVYQASLAFLMRDAVSADSGLLAGYLSIEYEIEFLNLRPTVNKFILQGPPASKIDNILAWDPGQSVVSSTEPWVSLPQAVLGATGSWLIDKIESILGGNYLGRRGYMDPARNVPYSSTLTGLCQGAVLSDDAKDLMEFPPLRREEKGVVIKSRAMVEEVSTYFNPKFCPWANTLERKKNIPTALPATAGDFRVQLNLYTPEGGLDVVGYKDYSAGTGNVGVDFTVPYFVIPAISDGTTENTSEGQCCLFWTISPTGVETRQFSLNSAELSVRGSGI